MARKKQDDLTPIHLTIPPGMLPTPAEVEEAKQQFLSQPWVRQLIADCEKPENERDQEPE